MSKEPWFHKIKPDILERARQSEVQSGEELAPRVPLRGQLPGECAADVYGEIADRRDREAPRRRR